MAQPNDIVVLHVPFRGHREVTARDLKTFIIKQMTETNTTQTFGELAFVDIPVCTNNESSTCMAFVRSKTREYTQALQQNSTGFTPSTKTG